MSKEWSSPRFQHWFPFPKMERIWKVVLASFVALGIVVFTPGFGAVFVVAFSRGRLLNDVTFDSMADSLHLTVKPFAQI